MPTESGHKKVLSKAEQSAGKATAVLGPQKTKVEETSSKNNKIIGLPPKINELLGKKLDLAHRIAPFHLEPHHDSILKHGHKGTTNAIMV